MSRVLSDLTESSRDKESDSSWSGGEGRAAILEFALARGSRLY